jgi:hypothetical protein
VLERRSYATKPGRAAIDMGGIFDDIDPAETPRSA